MMEELLSKLLKPPAPSLHTCVGTVLGQPELDSLRTSNFDEYATRLLEHTRAPSGVVVTSAWKRGPTPKTVAFASGLSFERVCVLLRRALLRLNTCVDAEDALAARADLKQAAKEAEAFFSGICDDVIVEEMPEVKAEEIRKAAKLCELVAHCCASKLVADSATRAGLFRSIAEVAASTASVCPIVDDDEALMFDVALRALSKYCETQAHALSASLHFDGGKIEAAAACARRAADVARKAHLEHDWFTADFVDELEKNAKRYEFVKAKTQGTTTTKKTGVVVPELHLCAAVPLPQI